MDLTKLLPRLRMAFDENPTQQAHTLSTTKELLMSYENGKVDFTPSFISEIATAYKMSYQDLLSLVAPTHSEDENAFFGEPILISPEAILSRLCQINNIKQNELLRMLNLPAHLSTFLNGEKALPEFLIKAILESPHIEVDDGCLFYLMASGAQSPSKQVVEIDGTRGLSLKQRVVCYWFSRCVGDLSPYSTREISLRAASASVAGRSSSQHNERAPLPLFLRDALLSGQSMSGQLSEAAKNICANIMQSDRPAFQDELSQLRQVASLHPLDVVAIEYFNQISAQKLVLAEKRRAHYAYQWECANTLGGQLLYLTDDDAEAILSVLWEDVRHKRLPAYKYTPSPTARKMSAFGELVSHTREALGLQQSDLVPATIQDAKLRADYALQISRACWAKDSVDMDAFDNLCKVFQYEGIMREYLRCACFFSRGRIIADLRGVPVENVYLFCELEDKMALLNHDEQEQILAIVQRAYQHANDTD